MIGFAIFGCVAFFVDLLLIKVLKRKMKKIKHEYLKYGGSMLICHDLKILPAYFDAVDEGIKRFEIRKNDRNFHVGDVLRLNEWDEEFKKYTERKIINGISYMTDYQQKDGYVVLSLADVSNVLKVILSGKERKI